MDKKILNVVTLCFFLEKRDIEQKSHLMDTFNVRRVEKQMWRPKMNPDEKETNLLTVRKAESKPNKT